MDRMFSDRIETGEWTAPAAELVQVKVNYLRPVFAGKLVAAARVVHRGKLVGLVECDVATAEGKLVAHATSTCQVLRGEAARGR